MKQDELIERITLKPEILAGKPVIRGTRLSVQYILGLLAQGVTTQDILNEYDGLTEEDKVKGEKIDPDKLKEQETSQG